jgi:hypothetical protein
MTWEGMHSGTARDDRSYALGVEKGRFFEGGYLIRLLQDELTKVKNQRFDTPDKDRIIPGIVGLETAIKVLEDRCDQIRQRNGWE